jgi:uncharacterized protein
MASMTAFKDFKIKSGDHELKRRIQEVCRQIVQVAQPHKIILFGSYAYGQPTADSDIDLLVVLPFKGHPAYQATQLRMQLESPLRLDLLVRTPEFIAERLALGDFFMQEVMQQGKVVYEAPHPRMGRQSRKRLGQRAA